MVEVWTKNWRMEPSFGNGDDDEGFFRDEIKKSLFEFFLRFIFHLHLSLGPPLEVSIFWIYRTEEGKVTQEMRLAWETQKLHLVICEEIS